MSSNFVPRILLVVAGWTALLAAPARLEGAEPEAAEPEAAEPVGANDAAAAPKTVEAFMRTFEGLEGFEARFVETKTMALLAQPLVTEGRLYFTAPGRLLRVVDKPQETRVLVTPTAVTMGSGERTQRLELAARPEVRSLVSSLLSLMSGDLAALKTTYEVGYDVRAGGWTLTLTPRSKRLGALVERMRFEGRGRTVQRITIAEASGDRVVTDIVQADPGRRFTPEERRRLFGTP